MCPGGRHPQSATRRQLDHRTAQAHELGPKVGGTPADLAAHFHHRLMQLRLDLLEHEMVALEDLGDVGAKLAGLGIDDLVLFFDTQRERWRLHRGPGNGLWATVSREDRDRKSLADAKSELRCTSESGSGVAPGHDDDSAIVPLTLGVMGSMAESP